MRQRIRYLLGKELRQLRRSRGALLSATLMPVFLLILTPAFELSSLRAAAAQGQITSRAASGALPPDVAQDPTRLFLRFLFPLLLTLGGLIVPSVAATYTIIGERERGSLELLLSLPVRVHEILVAKLVAMLALALVVILPLFTLDVIAFLALGLVSLADILGLLGVMLAALVYAIGEALLLALLARDLRTAQQLNGAMLIPITLVVGAVLLLAPASLALPSVIALLLLGACAACFVGLRWLTVERYLL